MQQQWKSRCQNIKRGLVILKCQQVFTPEYREPNDVLFLNNVTETWSSTLKISSTVAKVDL